MKSGNSCFFFLTSLCSRPTYLALPPSALDYTLGEPVAFPVICVVNKLSHSLTLMSVNESQKHTAVQKKKKDIAKTTTT